MHNYYLFVLHMLLIGDFNSVAASGDRMSGNLDPTSIQLQSFLGLNNFSEPLGNHLNTFTYHHLTISTHISHIDRAYTNFPNRWMGYAQSCSYSDHYCMGLFIPKPDDLGPQPWKFPNNLISDNSFSQQVELIVQNFNSNDSAISWEVIKSKIQEISRKCTSFYQKQSSLELAALKKSLRYVNARIFYGEDLNEDRLLLENKIHQIWDQTWFYDHDLGYAWLENEGMMSPDFLHLEDIKQQPGLDSLRIGGCLTLDVTMILLEILFWLI